MMLFHPRNSLKLFLLLHASSISVPVAGVDSDESTGAFVRTNASEVYSYTFDIRLAAGLSELFKRAGKLARTSTRDAALLRTTGSTQLPPVSGGSKDLGGGGGKGGLSGESQQEPPITIADFGAGSGIYSHYFSYPERYAVLTDFATGSFGARERLSREWNADQWGYVTTQNETGSWVQVAQENLTLDPLFQFRLGTDLGVQILDRRDHIEGEISKPISAVEMSSIKRFKHVDDVFPLLPEEEDSEAEDADNTKPKATKPPPFRGQLGRSAGDPDSDSPRLQGWSFERNELCGKRLTGVESILDWKPDESEREIEDEMDDGESNAEGSDNPDTTTAITKVAGVFMRPDRNRQVMLTDRCPKWHTPSHSGQYYKLKMSYEDTHQEGDDSEEAFLMEGSGDSTAASGVQTALSETLHCFDLTKSRETNMESSAAESSPGPALSPSVPKQFDFVLSLEVGEHLPSDQATARFLATVTREARVGVVLSWAVPGQWGQGHVNNLDNIAVRDAMSQRGFILDWELSLLLRRVVTAMWFRRSVMVFWRAEGSESGGRTRERRRLMVPHWLSKGAHNGILKGILEAVTGENEVVPAAGKKAAEASLSDKQGKGGKGASKFGKIQKPLSGKSEKLSKDLDADPIFPYVNRWNWTTTSYYPRSRGLGTEEPGKSNSTSETAVSQDSAPEFPITSAFGNRWSLHYVARSLLGEREKLEFGLTNDDYEVYECD